MAKPALGRGLGALLGGAATAPKTPTSLATAATTTTVTAAPPVDPRDRVQRIPLARIRPCPFQ
ncbi:MAG: ParB/RepB/Spo0J family partition protein, partial [Anaerolineales bacterium]